MSFYMIKYLKIDFASDGYSEKYRDLKSKVDTHAFYLENAIANHLYWWRIRADYRADFESLVKPKDITDALYIGVSFLNVANYLVHNKSRFGRVISDKNSFYSENIIRGRIIDFVFDRIKITRALLLSSEYSAVPEEDSPDEHFIIRKLPTMYRNLEDYESDSAYTYSQEISQEYHIEELRMLKGDLLIKGDGSFEIKSKDKRFLYGFLPTFFSECLGTHPESFIILQINPSLTPTLYIQTKLTDFI